MNAIDSVHNLQHIQAQQLAFCDRLELIADQLPNVDRALCIGVAHALMPLLEKAHNFEESFLFPALVERCGDQAGTQATLERLRYEHLEDLCFAEELHDALMAYGRGELRPNPEAFGYMLRGFFEGMRRHILFERDVVLPMIAATSGTPQTAQSMSKGERASRLRNAKVFDLARFRTE